MIQILKQAEERTRYMHHDIRESIADLEEELEEEK